MNECIYCASKNIYEFNDNIIDSDKLTLKVSLECHDCGQMYQLLYKLESMQVVD